MRGYIQRQWGKHGINKISMKKNGIVLVKFDNPEGKNEVLQGGIYHIDNKPFIVKAWNEDMEFTREELYTVPIWVKLLGLDFKYWGPKRLSKIGSLIGKPLMADKNTEKKIGLNFARLLIEVDVDTPLPDKVYFRNEKGNIIEQKVQYDWKPVLCKYCKKYGHSEVECRIKKPRSPPNQLVAKTTPSEGNNSPTQPEQVGGDATAPLMGKVTEPRKGGTCVTQGGAKEGQLQRAKAKEAIRKFLEQQDKRTGWASPLNTSKMPRVQGKQGVYSQNPFDVLEGPSTSQSHQSSQVAHGGGTDLVPKGTG
ncbi:uncharacterized protein LOC132639194 [Lycium barbarum]|uniref:uncharacterized protein LOC132639194 n=1 Tax=Lycium barbarum TaxID=112863 RepID=UPI00293F1965|nr:uncharacterized protein LOC132639194 [Lycium barbarum]